jgi:HK97 family phage major capsid protein
MNLELRKKEIETRLTEIRKSADAETDASKLEALEKECDTLQEERTSILKKLGIASKTDIKPVIDAKENRNTELETRGQSLRERRAITVATPDILIPTHTAPDIGQTFNQISGLVDKVKVVNLDGGESYEKAYVKNYGVAGLTLEGAAYANTEPTFGYATINKVKVTAYTEITEEVEKLPNLAYQAEIIKNIGISLKKKLSQQIIGGDGTSNNFTGLFSTSATALETSKDLKLSEINNTTLDDIIFSYGGDEDLENGAVLILSKPDLKAFAKLRTTDGRKLHDINYSSHTIDGISYVINSNCSSLASATTVAGTYCMAYGSLQNYEMPIFSPVEIQKSTDYKFKEGQICYKASLFTGGNVVSFNGFIRIQKAA